MPDATIWNSYGLTADPYSILPLTEGGALSVDQVFVGRQEELGVLMQTMTGERVTMLINGNVGVGKTSLLNFHKHRCRSLKKETPFLAPRREIEATSDLLHKKTFLLEILSTLYWEVKLIDPTKVERDDFLKKIGAIVDFTSRIELNTSSSLSAGFAGINVAESRSVAPPMELTINSIEHRLEEFVEWIRNNDVAGKKHKGIIIHMNNFDVALRENVGVVRHFFDEIRDTLQMKYLFFFLLGPSDFYHDAVADNPRIRAVCAPPLCLQPLSKTELCDALDRRYERLRINKFIAYIPPLSKEAIYSFYDIFNGDIRSILSTCRELVEGKGSQSLQNVGREEAFAMLGKLKWEAMKRMGIDTPAFRSVVEYITEHPEGVIQTDVAKALKKVRSNMAGYYFKELKQKGIVEQVLADDENKQDKRVKYWKFTRDFQVLYFYKNAAQAVQRSQEQLSLL
ncbi:MAG: hypothetical protein PHZ00_02885 [Candidatus Peribacteraceae bacterium]|nr:hypothetical protein [Candidatus Peribacteraceae bacterium]